MVKKINIDKLKVRAAIQLNYNTHKQESNSSVAKKFNVNHNNVERWKNRTSFFNKAKNRKSKLSPGIRSFLFKSAKNKFSGINNSSCRKLAKEINNVFNLSVSFKTVNNWLNSIFGKPKKAKKTFLLKEKDKTKRIEFAKMILDNNIKGKDIFFLPMKSGF